MGIWFANVEHFWEMRPFVTIVLSIVIITANCLIAYFLLEKPDSTGGLLRALIETEDGLHDTRRRLEDLQNENEKLVYIQSYCLIAAQLSGAHLVNRAPNEIAKLVLGALSERKKELFDIEYGEFWSLSLYIMIRPRQRLRCIFRKLSENHPSRGGVPREWEPGKGFVGLTFTSDKGPTGIIIGDARAPEVEQTYSVSGLLGRSYDETAYASFASFCLIGPPPNAERFGVLIATSSRRNAFAVSSATPLRFAALQFSALAPAFARDETEIDWHVADH
jgi:hypothetical protein